MDKKYNILEIPNNADRYKTLDDYYSFVGKVLRTLIEAEQDIKVWNDGYTTVFEFNPNDNWSDLGCPHLEWIDPEEDVVLPKGDYSNSVSDEISKIEVANFYTSKISEFLREKNINLIDFYSDYLMDTKIRLVDLTISDLLGMVEHYLQENDDSLNTDRMVEENEQH